MKWVLLACFLGIFYWKRTERVQISGSCEAQQSERDWGDYWEQWLQPKWSFDIRDPRQMQSNPSTFCLRSVVFALYFSFIPKFLPLSFYQPRSGTVIRGEEFGMLLLGHLGPLSWGIHGLRDFQLQGPHPQKIYYQPLEAWSFRGWNWNSCWDI